MTISANYPIPVWVNGYACDNCAQVAEAKQGINPADPTAGPYGVDAGAPGTSSTSGAGDQSPAVSFGGALSGLGASTGQGAAAANPTAPGARLDISI